MQKRKSRNNNRLPENQETSEIGPSSPMKNVVIHQTIFNATQSLNRESYINGEYNSIIDPSS